MMITIIAIMMAATVARFQGFQSTSQAAPAKYPRHALESFTHRESDLPKLFGKAKPQHHNLCKYNDGDLKHGKQPCEAPDSSFNAELRSPSGEAKTSKVSLNQICSCRVRIPGQSKWRTLKEPEKMCNIPKWHSDWKLQFYTLWLFNIAMENCPFIDGLPIKNCDFPWLC